MDIILYIIVCLEVEAEKKERIVLREIHLRTTGRHLSIGSHSVICHPTEVTARLYPNRADWYSIYRPVKDERLSWPSKSRSTCLRLLPIYTTKESIVRYAKCHSRLQRSLAVD